MSVKYADVPGIGQVAFQKKRGSRSLRINISHQGQVRVTMPTWAPYKMAVDFVMTKQAWVEKHKPKQHFLTNNLVVGKAHRLIFIRKNITGRPTTRISGNLIKVFLPDNCDFSDPNIQKLANQAIIKALKQEAELLLPIRLKQIALKHSFTYEQVTIKRLSSRWGSCDNKGNITLNCYLMQLPWRLIDYVLLHELMHTRIMAHGAKFWYELSHFVPNLPDVRKEIRIFRPSLYY